MIKIEYDVDIYLSIAEFIYNNLINYQRNVARTIYKAIEERDKTEKENDIHTKVNTNYKNKFVKT